MRILDEHKLRSLSAYSPDEPRDSHGRWGSGDSEQISSDALKSSGIDFEKDIKPYLRGGTNLTQETVDKLSALPWRAFKADWGDDVDKMFGTSALKAGDSVSYTRPPYSSWSKDESAARSFLPIDRESNEYHVVMSSVPTRASLIADFTQLADYHKYKWNKEAETLQRGSVPVTIRYFKAPSASAEWRR